MTRELLLIAVGGATGSVLRYLTDLAVISIAGNPAFFTGIFTANMIGCFMIGFFFGRMEHYKRFEQEVRLFLLVGLIGSYTTYSAYALEGLVILSSSLAAGLIYIFIQALTGILFVWLGLYLYRYLFEKKNVLKS